MISCVHIHPDHFHRPDPAGHAAPSVIRRVKHRARRDPLAGLLLIGAASLALAGCGHEGHEDSYPATSGVIVDGGAGTTAETAAGAAGDQTVSQIAGQVPGQVPGHTSSPDATPPGTILFMASPGDGQPPRLIAHTSSVTSVPTAEFLAREALASQPRATEADLLNWLFFLLQKYLTRPDTSDSGVDTGETDASSCSAEPVKFIDRLQESTIQTVLATQVRREITVRHYVVSPHFVTCMAAFAGVQTA